MIRTFALTLIGVLFGTFLLAQKGIIRGKVTDAKTGETLIGAAVVIAGTTNGSSTDIDGNYSIEALQPGTYNLVCRFISYDSDTIRNVQVKANEVTIQNFTMGESAIELDVGVEITARQDRASENYMLTMQKKSATVMDGISSSQIKRAGDSDAAGAVKRVTGVSVEGGKYVYVRGLSDRYSLTLLNGAQIPSLDPQRNSVQLDIFPTNLIDNIVIVKTFSPEYPANWAGGLIDITTKDFPEKFNLQVSSSIGYNENATFNDDFITSEESDTDWLGWDDGSRDVPKEALNQNLRRYTGPPNGWVGVLDHFGIQHSYEDGDSPSIIDIANEVDEIESANQLLGLRDDYVAELNEPLSEAGRSFPNTWEPIEQAPPLNQSYGISIGNQTKLFGKPLGFNVGANYSYSAQGYTDGFVGRYNLTGDIDDASSLNTDEAYRDQRGTQSVLWGALGNVNLKLTSTDKIGFTVFHNQSGDNRARYQIGPNPVYEAGTQQETRINSYLERSLTSYQLKGEHYFENNDGPNLKMDWSGTYTLSNQDTPDLRLFTNILEINEEDTVYRIERNLQLPNRFYRDMQENNYDAQVNFELPFDNYTDLTNKLKFGGRYVFKDRNLGERAYAFNFESIRFNGNPSDYFADENFNTDNEDGYIFVEDNTQDVNSYFAEQSVWAGYVMTDYNITPTLRGIGGVRYETTNIFVQTKGISESDLTDEEIEERTGELILGDILPSASLTWNFRENMNLRGAYSRTLARPTFRELGTFSRFDQQFLTVLTGNPDLERTLIDNYDLRWEWFPNPGEVLSASLFYKNFTNPIERITIPTAQNREITYDNLDRSELYGIEIEARKRVATVGNTGIDAGFNVSFIEAYSQIRADELELIRANDPDAEDTRDMFGQSPYIVNGFLAVTNDSLGLDVSVTYNEQGPRMVLVNKGATPNVYEQPRPSLNLVINKTFGEHWKVSAKASNLLDSEYLQTYGSDDFKGEQYTFQRFQLGRSYSLGVTYKI